MVTKPFGMEVVGRNPKPSGTPVPTPAPTTGVDMKAFNDMLSRIDQRLGSKGIKIPKEGLSGLSIVDSLTPTQLVNIGKILKKKGYSVKASEADIKRLLADDPILIGMAEQSSSYDDLSKMLMADYLPGLDTSVEKAPNLPSRQIYKYRDEDIDAIINDTYEATVMRKPSPEELEKQRNIARKKLEMGTLSTTKPVKNPKTGKLENVTVQTPGSSTEEIKTDIQTQLEKMNPDEIDRKKRIDFSSWLTQNAAGA
jgi:hypothetical protein